MSPMWLQKHNIAKVFTKGKADPTMVHDLVVSIHLSHPIPHCILPR